MLLLKIFLFVQKTESWLMERELEGCSCCGSSVLSFVSWEWEWGRESRRFEKSWRRSLMSYTFSWIYSNMSIVCYEWESMN